LLAKRRNALNPGGVVAIKDFIMDEAGITGWLFKEGLILVNRFAGPRRPSTVRFKE
jgi:hypothetical protein